MPTPMSTPPASNDPTSIDPTSAGDGGRRSSRPAMSRRAALGAIGLGGAAVAVAACSGSASSAVRATTVATVPTGTPTALPVAGAVQTPVALLSDPSMNYDLLTVVGSAAYKLAEVGEVFTATHTINTAGVTLQNYVETFLAWGDQLASQAAQFSQAGDPVGAAHDTLRASNYYQSALFFVLGTTLAAQEKAVYQKMRATWDQAVPSLAPVAEPVQIPYQDGTSMQGWFFAPDRSGRKRPTLIVNNGSDGQEPWVWGYGGAAGLEWGWNTLLFDGPGQGSSLFLNEWPFRYDWENVITPVVDYLVTRSDVDTKKIALSGGSMGGELIARAAAFEHRLAAIVCAPGCVDPWAAFPAELTAIVTKDKAATNAIWVNDVIPALDPTEAFNIRKRLEPYDPAAMAAARAGRTTTDFWTPAQTIIQQRITDLVKDISCPTLVVNYDDEQFYPGQSQQMYDLLKAPKELLNLTEAQGAQMHCSPMAPQRQNDGVFAWLQATVGAGIPANG